MDTYADAGSAVYAPLQRDGRFPDSRPQGKTIETEHFLPTNASGIDALEAFLPKGALEPRIKVRHHSQQLFHSFFRFVEIKRARAVMLQAVV